MAKTSLDKKSSFFAAFRRIWDCTIRPPLNAIEGVLRRREIRRSLANPETAEAALGNLEGWWPERIRLACDCPDNAYIPRVPDAGKLADGWITMHNGLKVSALGYYGAGILNMLVENKGVHEPQEERVFLEAVKSTPKGAVMIELGAYWGFYSMWFQKEVPGAVNYLIEPRFENIESGRLNFRSNGMRGDFTQAWVGGPETQSRDDTPVLQIDAFVENKRIPFIHMLHSDIQSAELQMLHGARQILKEHRVGYVFLSSHSAQLHEECRAFLEDLGYVLISSATPAESYSVDGILVMRSGRYEGLDTVQISHRTEIAEYEKDPKKKKGKKAASR